MSTLTRQRGEKFVDNSSDLLPEVATTIIKERQARVEAEKEKPVKTEKRPTTKK